MTVQPGLCRTWPEPKLLVFSRTGSIYVVVIDFVLTLLRDTYMYSWYYSRTRGKPQPCQCPANRIPRVSSHTPGANGSPGITCPSPCHTAPPTLTGSVWVSGVSATCFRLVYEPPRGKTNNVVSEQVRHKSGCTVTEAG